MSQLKSMQEKSIYTYELHRHLRVPDIAQGGQVGQDHARPDGDKVIRGQPQHRGGDEGLQADVELRRRHVQELQRQAETGTHGSVVQMHAQAHSRRGMVYEWRACVLGWSAHLRSRLQTHTKHSTHPVWREREYADRHQVDEQAAPGR